MISHWTAGLITGIVIGILATSMVCGLISIYFQAKARRRRMMVLHEDRWRTSGLGAYDQQELERERRSQANLYEGGNW